jgi:hypothetical protein
MEDKLKKYLDTVVRYLLSDTIIDYYEEKIYFPFLTIPSKRFSIYLFVKDIDTSPTSKMFSDFYQYTKDIYGLTEDETKYVWKIYISTIKETIE